MRNLEFKARLADPEAALTRALALGAERAADLRQTDTYFGVANGRLKLRETAGREAELIHYERDESSNRRGSDYGRVPLAEPAALRELMGRALGVSAVVRKRRQLLLLDTTRIHLDNVEGLGDFLEIEVPVTDPSAEADAAARLESLIARLGLDRAEGIRASYADLITAERGMSA